MVAIAGIEIDGLAKAYGPVRALDGVSFSVPEGATCALAGRAGAGKSTLCRVLAGIEPADAGKARLAGQPAGDPATRRDLGYLAQRPGLDGDRTPLEVLRLVARVHGLGPSEVERRAEEAALRAGVDHVATHAIHNLAPGTRRRVALAAALVHEPAILVADEPLAGLDEAARDRTREALEAATADRTALVATGTPSRLAPLCSGVLALDGGRVRVDARVDELRGEAGARYRVEVPPARRGDAVARLREHEAVAALHPEGEGALVVWVADAGRAAAVLADLVGAGVEVAAFARARPDLDELVAEHLEGPT